MKSAALRLGILLVSGTARAGEPTGLPLPPAPAQLVIPDASAFDAALAGRWRLALTGAPEAADPLLAAWRQTPVGAKLEDQWRRLSGDLPWSWTEIRRLQPRAVGVALLSVGSLEAVLAIETPLATLPLKPPAGRERMHQGVAYRFVERGAADGATGERRAGLAWTRLGRHLVLATSERALRLAIDEALSGRSAAAALPGLASLVLDVAALRRDLYFKREFLFLADSGDERILAALRLEAGNIVEVREGHGLAAPLAQSFGAAADIEAAWEPEGATLWPALRAALIEPLPRLLEQPVPSEAPLPPATVASEDLYLVDLRKPMPAPGAAQGGEGELPLWRKLALKNPVAGWGHAVASDGSRRIVFEWPEALDGELLALCRQSLERRAGRVETARLAGVDELRVGPGLAALAVRRTGRFVWFGPNAASLASALEPTAQADLVRWARLDLAAVREASARWERVEGPAAPERVRPLSDRILGLLGWMPSVTRLTLERRQRGESWTERLVFEHAPR